MALFGDWGRPGGVTFSFTGRTGGVSEGAYASLNLGDRCGDDPKAVAENRRRALEALGAGHLADRLVNPVQVHGDHVVVVREGSDEAVRAAVEEARAGADAVVCTAEEVPVLLCYADCVPVVLVAERAFAVVHSGWRGTEACIAAKALGTLCAEAACAPADVRAYIGPHIGREDYAVSADLAERFAGSFGPQVVGEGCTLDLELALRVTLERAGMPATSIASIGGSTARETDRFYSYRAEGGTCGRHGALAFMERRGEEA